ncbi:MAG: hypothetical protein ABFC38_14200 [Methanospirillum sp.]
MSLTSRLNDPPIRQRFTEEFKKPRVSINAPILATPISKDPNLVGMAFDYLLRYHIGRLNRVKQIPEKWIAYTAYRLIETKFPGSELARNAEHTIIRGRIESERFHGSGELPETLLTSCCELAQVERIYRSKFSVVETTKIGEDEIEDLRQLYSILDKDAFVATSRCLLNPTFGDASLLVGGADADLIIDDLLVDIKTTKKIEVSRDYFNQLIGYALLHQINQQNHGNVRDPDASLSRVGIYFSRYAYLWTVNLDDIIPEGFDNNFVEWFIKTARNSPK